MLSASEVLRELSLKTGLPESAAEAVLDGLRELIRDGQVDERMLVAADDATGADAAIGAPIANPEDPRVVDEVIARARKHPLGLEFLVSGFLASVAIALGAHAFTVEAARARLRKEQAAAEPKETTAS
ncbi:MAG: hypothetical protein ACXW5U_26275 [Thermoanaerobaculia bacterium]